MRVYKLQSIQLFSKKNTIFEPKIFTKSFLNILILNIAHKNPENFDFLSSDY